MHLVFYRPQISRMTQIEEVPSVQSAANLSLGQGITKMKEGNRLRTQRRGIAAAVMGLVLVLGVAAERRDEAALPSHIFRFEVDFDSTAGEIRPFLGVQGAPRPFDPRDSDLTARYREAGIRIVRIPQDDGFASSLAGIFPDATKSPDDPEAYHFEAIDRLMSSIIEAGATPLWTAGYDIGGGDDWTASNTQGGRAPRDPEKWASVIRHVLMHWNEGWAHGYRWNVRHVEFINEPFGLGGFDYRRPEKCWRVYETFVRAIRLYNAENGRKIQVAGFSESMGKQGLERRLRLVDSFLEFARSRDCFPDIFTYHSYDASEGQLAVARALRDRLNRAGLGHVPLWNSEWNLSPSVLPPDLRNLARRLAERGIRDWGESVNWPRYYPETADLMRRGSRRYSAFIGVHNAQTRTLLQDVCEEMITYRANRGADRHGRRGSEYMFFQADGTPKPAYWSWVAFRRLADSTPQRLVTRAAAPVTLLAGKSEEGGRWSVLAANSEERAVAGVIAARGLPAGGVFQVTRYVIDEETTRWEPADSATVSAAENGTLEIPFAHSPFSIQFWDFEATP
jgi:hypothetical protein